MKGCAVGFFSDIWGGIKSVASNVWSTVKETAGEVVGWMAEKAEGFVGAVKNVWKAVKPHLDKVQLALRAGAAFLTTTPLAFLSPVLLALDKGITVLTTFSNSPVAKKVDQAIKFAINIAKKWQAGKEQSLGVDELKEAKRHQETFRLAERESASEDERHKLELMAAVNDFQIARTDLANALDGEPSNFEHYLRLRATQKLLNMSEKAFLSAKTAGDLGADDLFLVRIASDLVKENPALNSLAADRLDKILSQKYGKPLISFVYEELIAAWKVDAASLSKELSEAQNRISKDIVLLRRLTADKKIQSELSKEDSAILERLEAEVPKQEREVNDLATRQRDVERYANAAEGFLQLLEKTPEQLEQEDRAYVLEEGNTVGKIIIDVADKKIPFSSLSKEDQSLINDFSNVFKKEAGERMKVLEVTA